MQIFEDFFQAGAVCPQAHCCWTMLTVELLLASRLNHMQVLTPYRICLCMLLDQGQSDPHEEESKVSEQLALFMLKKINVRSAQA